MPASETFPAVAVVILAYNEEANIAQALASVVGWADEIHILDSLSTDRTVEIARQYGSHISHNPRPNHQVTPSTTSKLTRVTSASSSKGMGA